ncbi:hypothetical protein HDU97_004914 [Phlyctochytrium planicorne]|nr:hypothetical protein HDU97_004914 [Phlyctochytrium planicorne]
MAPRRAVSKNNDNDNSPVPFVDLSKHASIDSGINGLVLEEEEDPTPNTNPTDDSDLDGDDGDDGAGDETDETGPVNAAPGFPNGLENFKLTFGIALPTPTTTRSRRRRRTKTRIGTPISTPTPTPGSPVKTSAGTITVTGGGPTVQPVVTFGTVSGSTFVISSPTPAPGAPNGNPGPPSSSSGDNPGSGTNPNGNPGTNPANPGTNPSNPGPGGPGTNPSSSTSIPSSNPNGPNGPGTNPSSSPTGPGGPGSPNSPNGPSGPNTNPSSNPNDPSNPNNPNSPNPNNPNSPNSPEINNTGVPSNPNNSNSNGGSTLSGSGTIPTSIAPTGTVTEESVNSSPNLFGLSKPVSSALITLFFLLGLLFLILLVYLIWRWRRNRKKNMEVAAAARAAAADSLRKGGYGGAGGYSGAGGLAEAGYESYESELAPQPEMKSIGTSTPRPMKSSPKSAGLGSDSISTSAPNLKSAGGPKTPSPVVTTSAANVSKSYYNNIPANVASPPGIYFPPPPMSSPPSEAHQSVYSTMTRGMDDHEDPYSVELFSHPKPMDLGLGIVAGGAMYSSLKNEPAQKIGEDSGYQYEYHERQNLLEEEPIVGVDPEPLPKAPPSGSPVAGRSTSPFPSRPASMNSDEYLEYSHEEMEQHRISSSPSTPTSPQAFSFSPLRGISRSSSRTSLSGNMSPTRRKEAVHNSMELGVALREAVEKGRRSGEDGGVGLEEAKWERRGDKVGAYGDEAQM